eukprot:2518451-Amphidinium_carterae.1
MYDAVAQADTVTEEIKVKFVQRQICAMHEARRESTQHHSCLEPKARCAPTSHQHADALTKLDGSLGPRQRIAVQCLVPQSLGPDSLDWAHGKSAASLAMRVALHLNLHRFLTRGVQPKLHCNLQAVSACPRIAKQLPRLDLVAFAVAFLL